MKHKHEELIKAWATGTVIQEKSKIINGTWWDRDYPRWSDNNSEFRIKPDPPIIRWLWAYKTTTGFWVIHKTFFTDEEVVERFYGDCYEYIKLEYTRSEFPS